MIKDVYKGKRHVDKVFFTAAKAKEAKEKYGVDKVIDATIGSLYGEDSKLVVYDVVKQEHLNLDPAAYAAYAQGIPGNPAYREAVLKGLFGKDYKKKLKDVSTSVVATPGGTGAINNTIRNYVDEGETVLLPEWMWGTYKMMARENSCKYETYKMFDKDGNFYLKDIKKKMAATANNQKTVCIVINDPCHNPTGYRMTVDEWKELRTYAGLISAKTNVVMLIDVAYIDYGVRSKKECEELIKLLTGMNNNILVVITTSISKSMSSYGMRVGAQVAISSSPKIIEEFENAATFSARATWSNVCREGMEIFANIINDDKKYAKLLAERESYVKLLADRADIFIKEAAEVGLDILPYRSGFFLTVPTGKATAKVVELLEKKNIFVLDIEKGIRIAICSVPLPKLPGLATQVKKALDKAEKELDK